MTGACVHSIALGLSARPAASQNRHAAEKQREPRSRESHVHFRCGHGRRSSGGRPPPEVAGHIGIDRMEVPAQIGIDRPIPGGISKVRVVVGVRAEGCGNGNRHQTQPQFRAH